MSNTQMDANELINALLEKIAQKEKQITMLEVQLAFAHKDEPANTENPEGGDIDDNTV